MIQPLFSDLLTGTILHGLLNIIAGYVGEQAVYPYTYLILVLFLEPVSYTHLLLGVDRGVPEVWGSVYDVRELLDSSVKLMDGMSPLEIELPGPLNALKKPLLRVVKGTVVEKLLRDHNVIKDGMLD